MQYAAPATVKEAAALLAKAKGVAKILAGGSDLLVQMKSGMLEPDLVVDVKRIKPLTEIKKDAKGFTVGSAVSCASLRENKALRAAWPAVIEGAKLIGSTQVQGRATIAGNLCNASPAADSVPALAACGAKAVIAGPSKKRTVAVEDVPVGPGKTSLKKGEFVEAITLPKPAARTGSAYLRFTPRTEMDIAVASAGVALTLDAKGVCTSAKIVLGAVGPRVINCAAAAKALIGSKPDAGVLAKVQAAASAAATPIDDKRGTKEFRIDVVGVLARRATETALKRARGE